MIMRTVTTLGLLAALVSQAWGAEPIEIGHYRQLFLDDHVIESRSHIRKQLHQATPFGGNPIVEANKPWESGLAYHYGSVEWHPESKRYRLWYQSFWQVGEEDPIDTGLIATSRDGLKWEFPRLGLVPDQHGNKNNNMVMSLPTHSGFDEGLTPIRDPNPADPKKVWRSLIWSNGDGHRGTYTAWSPDGLRWSVSKKPVFRDCGDAGTIMYDYYRKRWIFLARPLDNQLSRAVRLSDDFETWGPMKVIFQADKEKREDFYNMSGFCYEGLYIGMVVLMWEEPGRYALEPHLAVSRDGENWQFVSQQIPFIAHGPRGSWEEFNTQIGAGGPMLIDGKLHFYYSGRNYPHTPYYNRGRPELVPEPLLKTRRCSVGVATLRRDGFVSLRDHFGGGEVTTKNLRISGKTLHVNVKNPFGSLRVEVLDATGKPLPGYGAEDCIPIRGDSTDLVVRWKQRSGIYLPGDQPVSLRFLLEKTDLYSFWID